MTATNMCYNFVGFRFLGIVPPYGNQAAAATNQFCFKSSEELSQNGQTRGHLIVGQVHKNKCDNPLPFILVILYHLYS